MFKTSAVATASVLCAACAFGNGDLGTVEAAALAQRTRIQQLKVTYRHDAEEFFPDAGVRHSVATVWRNGRQARSDSVDDHPGLGPAAGRRTVTCVGCDEKGRVLDWADVPSLSATLKRPKSGEADGGVPEVRLLGYAPSPVGMLHTSRLDRYVGRPGRRDVRLTREKMGAADCCVMRHPADPNGLPAAAIWYDIDRGMHPVRMEVEVGGAPADTLRREITTDLQSVSDSLWFPRTVVYVEAIGGRVRTRETVTVTAIEVNTPFPPDTFTLGGVGMPDGTPIETLGESGNGFVWRGGRAVRYDADKAAWEKANPPPPTVPVPLDPEPARPRYWLYAVGAVLGVAAVGLLTRAVRNAR